MEIAHHDAPAREPDVAHQGAQQARRLDHHAGKPADIGAVETIGAGRQQLRFGQHSGDQALGSAGAGGWGRTLVIGYPAPAVLVADPITETRRVGTAGVRNMNTRWSPYH